MNKTQHLVGKCLSTGLAEMEVNIAGSTVNGFYHIRRRCVRGRWSVAALRHQQGNGIALVAGAVAPRRGGGGTIADRCVEAVGHRFSPFDVY